MFNKLKQFKDLRSQAKTMQDALAKESVTEEKNGVKINTPFFIAPTSPC